MTENVLKIISFSAGITFSAALLGFSLFQLSKDQSNPLYVGIICSILGIYIPSPFVSISSNKTPVTTPTTAPTPTVPIVATVTHETV
jgi:hypothetical protein